MMKNPKRLFGFSEIMLNKKLFETMPGFHAATGSDFTCSFHGFGKTKSLNLLVWTTEVIGKFICEFYGKQNTAELNDTRVIRCFFGKENHLTLSEYHQLGIGLCFTLSVQIM